jgi:opacity protein-like surface antigen
MVLAQDDRKATAYFGGGISPTSGDFGDRHEMGWGLLGGGGYKFNPNFGLNLEWNYDRLSYKYSNPNVPPNLPPGVITVLDGTTQLNGFSVNPRWNFKTEGPVSGYVTGGYGIYNQKFQITRPGTGSVVVCDPWWGWCYEGLVPVDYLLKEYSTWKGGFNVGGGVEFGGESGKFFVDVRYRYIYTTNVRTSYIPITFGFRF